MGVRWKYDGSIKEVQGEYKRILRPIVPLYFHRTSTVLPSYSHSTFTYFHYTSTYSQYTSIVLPSYSHGTSTYFHCTPNVLPRTPIYSHIFGSTWKYVGSPVGVQWEYVKVPWEYDRSTMGVQWKYR